MKRAAETAQIAVGDRYDIIYDDQLIERSFGDFEGKVVKSWSELVDGAMSKAFDWALTKNSADDVFGKTHLGNAEAKVYNF